MGDVSVRDGSVFQIPLQHCFIADGGFLRPFLRRGGEVHAAAVQPPLQFLHQLGAVSACQVHLIHKEECGHAVPLQQPPQCPGVGLDAVGAADDQHGAVQHPESPLRLGGEVHMAGGVQQRHLRIAQRQQRLLGEDGDAPLPLDGIRIQKGVPVVHPPQLPQRAAAVEQCLGQGCFSGVHMGQDAQDQFLHGFAPVQ